MSAMWWNFWNNLPWKCRRRMRERDVAFAAVGLDRNDVDRLAIYNSENWRGVAHTAEMDTQMADLQERYNKAMMRPCSTN